MISLLRTGKQRGIYQVINIIFLILLIIFLICIVTGYLQVKKDYNFKNENELQNSIHRFKIYLFTFFVLITIFTIICIVLSIGQIQFSFLSSKKPKLIKYIIVHICILLISLGLCYYMNSLLNNVSITKNTNDTNNIFVIIVLFAIFQLFVIFLFSSNLAKNWLNILHHYDFPHRYIKVDDVTQIRQESDENPLEHINSDDNENDNDNNNDNDNDNDNENEH